MWTSVSGLLAHGEKMNVIGNNISNVNTVGFKGQRMDFEDFVYQYVGTAAGVGQVGRGTSVGIVMNDFLQGSFETTTSATDIAIQGNGFFKVKPKYNNESYYTRAGNFSFDREGYLVDPHGYVLQGWEIDRNMANQITDSRSNSGIIGSGSPVDVKLDTFTCPPRHTTNLTLPVNLKKTDTAAESDKSTDATDPFFALLKTWDATQDPPIGKDKYAYQSTIEVYDEAGKMHKLTVYFDRVASDHGGQNIAGYSSNESYWEFIVTMNPSEDMRDFDSQYDPTGTTPTNPNVPDALKGLLGAGTITFDYNGQMKDMSFFVPDSDPSNAADTWWQGAPGAETVNLDRWIPAPISSNGFPMIAPNFGGTAGLQTPYTYIDGTGMDYTRPNINATDRLISIDLGLKNLSSEWHYLTTTTPLPETYTNPAAQTGLGNRLDLTTVAGYSAGCLDANGFPLGPDGNLLNTGGSVWNAGDLATQPYPPVQRKDAKGNPMNLYLVTNDPTGTGTVPYFTTDATLVADILAQPGGAIGSTTPIMDTDSRSMLLPTGPNGMPTAGDIGLSKSSINGMDGFAEKQNNATTNYGSSSFEHNGRTQDGYTYGDLRYVNVDTNGVLSATYSNGVTLQLFQITLHDFPSLQNLRREGGNLFSETRESGIPSTGAAGTGTFGTTRSYSLEQSNVDLSREFVNMITTQRGFQANSKNITTVDTMLETVISMKR